MSGLQLKNISNMIKEFDQLKYLNLSGNSLTKIPDTVTGISTLETLLLNDNNLESLPFEIGTTHERY